MCKRELDVSHTMLMYGFRMFIAHKSYGQVFVVLLPPYLKFESFSQSCNFNQHSFEISPFVLFERKSHGFGIKIE